MKITLLYLNILLMQLKKILKYMSQIEHFEEYGIHIFQKLNFLLQEVIYVIFAKNIGSMQIVGWKKKRK
jgi:hypothetical protein